MPTTLNNPGRLELAVLRMPAQRTVQARWFSAALWPGYAFAFALVALAFAARLALNDLLPSGFPFLTFFPAVLVSAFVFGRYPGIVAAALSALVSWTILIPGTATTKLLPIGLFLFIVAVEIVAIDVMHRALRRADEARTRAIALADERDVVSHELVHRIKNLLANVSSLIAFAGRDVTDVPTLVDHVRSRLSALGAASTLLHSGRAMPVASIAEIAAIATAPFSGDDRIRIDVRSLDALMSSADGSSLSMIFHELATNAAKYGALSRPAGSIAIAGQWRDSIFVVTWSEASAPLIERRPVAAHAQVNIGFGTRLMERLERALGISILRFDDGQGLVVEIAIPRTRIQDATLLPI